MMRTLSLSLAALLVTAGVIAPADAGPITGSFGGDSTFTPTATPGHLSAGLYRGGNRYDVLLFHCAIELYCRFQLSR
jgi:hypothetical protein